MVLKADHQEFCAQKMMCSRNGNSELKNGHSACRKWKFFPMPWTVDFSAIFPRQIREFHTFLCSALKSKFHANFRNHGILERLITKRSAHWL